MSAGCSVKTIEPCVENNILIYDNYLYHLLNDCFYN